MERESILMGIATALACGLLIGAERERRKGSGALRGFAGVRTFSLTGLCGAITQILGQTWVTVTALFCISGLVCISHARDQSNDPGITTEVALLSSFLLGMLAMQNSALAAGLGVTVAALLFSRNGLQRFTTEILTERELHDGIVLAAVALILLPLLPNKPLADFMQINAHQLVLLVVMISAIQALGYALQRALGARAGLSISGLISGFVSSTATIANMAARARQQPALTSACISAALLSCVPTALQIILIAVAIAPMYLMSVLPNLLAMLATALLLGGLAYRNVEQTSVEEPDERAFNLWQALLFALLLTAMNMLVAWVYQRYGVQLVKYTVAMSALVDVHVAAAATLSLAAQKMFANDAVMMELLIALSANTFSKMLVTLVSARYSRFSLWVVLGLGLIMLAPWVVWAW